MYAGGGGRPQVRATGIGQQEGAVCICLCVCVCVCVCMRVRECTCMYQKRACVCAEGWEIEPERGVV